LTEFNNVPTMFSNYTSDRKKMIVLNNFSQWTEQVWSYCTGN